MQNQFRSSEQSGYQAAARFHPHSGQPRYSRTAGVYHHPHPHHHHQQGGYAHGVAFDKGKKVYAVSSGDVVKRKDWKRKVTSDWQNDSGLADDPESKIDISKVHNCHSVKGANLD